MNKLLTYLLSFSTITATANNIQVSNVQLTGQDMANNTYQVKFDISWENSWRTSTLESNWDAAWVFIKFSPLNQNLWQHATMNVGGAIAPAGATVEVVDDVPGTGVGAFIYRAADGMGDVSYSNVELQWNYGVSGIADDALVEVCVQAIEMVYIPPGEFFLGDQTGTAYASFETGTTNSPFQVTAMVESIDLTLGGTASTHLGNNRSPNNQAVLDDFDQTTTQTLPLSFPLGYDAFYIMKYEISQGQIRSFLQLIGVGTANNIIPSEMPCVGNPNGTCNQFGNTIFKHGSTYDAVWLDWPCNFMSWTFLKQYLHWAGLRPITETEYEKASRGPLPSLSGEFAWGNSDLYGIPYSFQNEGTPQSTIANMGVHIGNAGHKQTLASPRRCGEFAASAVNATREETGASYYGVMELTGNLREYYVSIGTATGRSFDGTHGSGDFLTNVTIWPTHTGTRGGSFTTNAQPPTAGDDRLQVSGRSLINVNISSPNHTVGGRGGRSAP